MYKVWWKKKKIAKKKTASRGYMLTIAATTDQTQPDPNLLATIDGGGFVLQEHQGSHILIIDDSNQICSLLASSIVSKCAETGQTVHIVQSGALGLLTTMPMVFSPENTLEPITIYTANSPKNGLPVLQLSNIHKLTIVCDIMTPADTEVGLFGLLRELTERQLKVNLVFASSEGQNRYYVEQLINRGKAFFVEKGSQAWIELPGALVNRSDMFEYKTIVRSDYDNGLLHAEEIYRPIQTKTVTAPLKRKWWQMRPFAKHAK